MSLDLQSIFQSFNRQPTVIDDMIAQACDSDHKKDPDIVLEMEIIDVIKQRKTGPREAALALLRHINSRNFREAMLALHLLDLCVKNCDYAFHLQIGSKEFLNGLVKRFPERPPVQRNPVIDKVLELLQLWDLSICATSKHKEDLKNIHEMVKLLGLKGYMFPEVKKEDVSAFTPHDQGFKTKEEMETEDMAEMGVKLQELLRRATPKDLEEANVLMKKMAGYEQRVDYNKKLGEELDRIDNSITALDALLRSVKPGDDIVNQKDVQDTLSKCKTAKPKLEKMLTEEDDPKIVNRVLVLNDRINAVLTNYDNTKTQLATSGRVQNNPAPLPVPVSQPKQEISLIDLDDFGAQKSDFLGQGQAPVTINNVTPKQTNTSAKPVDDLLDIFGAPPASQMTTSALAPSSSVIIEQDLYKSRGLKITTMVDGKSYSIDGLCSILFKVYNETANPFANFTFQIAVPKGVDQKLEPLSSSIIPAYNSISPVTQVMHIRNNARTPLKVRFRIAYFVNGQPITDQAESGVLVT